MFDSIRFETTEITGIGKEEGVCRRDPSDIIKVNDIYYVWYTKVTEGAPRYPEGYYGTIWYAVSTDEGHNWKERGQALAKDAPGAFDSFGLFTPSILAWEDKYYLYYTAVADGFINDGYCEAGKTAIGVAISDNPDGLWERCTNNPLLIPSANHADFDSFRVDDACMLAREGKIFMYHKGRQWERTPGETKMGVVIAPHPCGPFERQNGGQPIQPEGHEVQVWPEQGGVVSLVSNVGRGFYFAKDGISFDKITNDFEGSVSAPGAYRPDLTDHSWDKGVNWGITMSMRSHHPYLARWTKQEG